MIYIIILVVVVIIFIIVHQAAKKQVINEVRNQGGLILVLGNLHTAIIAMGFKLHKDEISTIEYRSQQNANCYISVRVWKNVNMSNPYEMKMEKFYNNIRVADNPPSFIGPGIPADTFEDIIFNEIERINLPTNEDVQKASKLSETLITQIKNSGFIKDYKGIRTEPLEIQLEFIKSELIKVNDFSELKFLMQSDLAEFYILSDSATSAVFFIHRDRLSDPTLGYIDKMHEGALYYRNILAPKISLLPSGWN